MTIEYSLPGCRFLGPPTVTATVESSKPTSLSPPAFHNRPSRGLRPRAPLRRYSIPSCAACPGRTAPLYALLRGASEGATAPRAGGACKRCGEARPPAGDAGGRSRGGDAKVLVNFLSAHCGRRGLNGQHHSHPGFVRILQAPRTPPPAAPPRAYRAAPLAGQRAPRRWPGGRQRKKSTRRVFGDASCRMLLTYRCTARRERTATQAPAARGEARRRRGPPGATAWRGGG